MRSFNRFLLASFTGALFACSLDLACAGLVESPFAASDEALPKLKSSFILPNEFYDGLYKPEAKGMTGALITVGTIRSFQRLLYGDFNWALFVDLDPAVVEFNRLNIQAIAKAKTLEQYLRNFPDLYEIRYGKYPEGFSNDRAGIRAWRLALFQFQRRHPQLDGMYAFLTEVGTHSTERRVLRSFYFNQESSFQALRRKLIKTPIVVLQSDLTSQKLAKNLKKFLDENRIKVSLLDLSNSLDYVFNASDMPEQYKLAAPKRFRALLEALPFEQRGKVFFTNYGRWDLRNDYVRSIQENFSRTRPDGFLYFSATPQNVIELLEERGQFSGKPPVFLDFKGPFCEQYLIRRAPHDT